MGRIEHTFTLYRNPGLRQFFNKDRVDILEVNGGKMAKLSFEELEKALSIVENASKFLPQSVMIVDEDTGDHLNASQSVKWMK